MKQKEGENMHVFIVYAHPSKDSVTYQLKQSFIQGLQAANHSYTEVDLYAMNFNPVYKEEEYKKDAYYQSSTNVDPIILKQQQLINESDVIVFVYPVFWSECPAILTGWFQRVFNCGFAYTNGSMKVLEKALCLVSMGGSENDPIHAKQMEAMRIVMLEDRISTRAKQKEMIFFNQTSREEKYASNREERLKDYYQKAYTLGKNL